MTQNTEQAYTGASGTMGREVECRSTAEAEAAIAAGDTPALIGDFNLVLSTSIRVVCRSGKPLVVAWGSSQPRVEARGSSQPRVVAKGSVQLRVSGSVAVVAATAVAILVCSGKPKIKGGGFVRRIDISTPHKWCDHYGVDVVRGVAVLGKALPKDLLSQRATPEGKKISYEVGTTPEAPDWDGGAVECGGGLNFSPVPAMGVEFCTNAERFLACPVRLREMAVHPDGQYPNKCKARRVASPIWEVDRWGIPVDERSRAIRDAFYAAPKKRRRS